jgi:hypothetical protein
MSDSQEQFRIDESHAETPDHVSEIMDSLPGWQSEEFLNDATDRAVRAELRTNVNTSARVLAAASVYATGLLVNEKVTQPVVSDAAGVSEAAIRRNYQAILETEGYDTSRANKSETEPRPTFAERLKKVIFQ